MDLSAFFQVVGIGFSVAAAVGPISVLCIQRTLQRGWRIGLISGLGVASADGLYGLVGGMGLAAITEILIGQQTLLRMIGGAVLLALGIRTIVSRQEYQPVDDRSVTAGYLSAYSSIFLLTLSNPMTILSFAAIYMGIGALGVGSHWLGAVVFSLAIFIGSLLWWLLLVSGVDRLRRYFQPAALQLLNRISGVVITAFGLIILWQAFKP